jgi:hypothetical protein
MDITKPAEGASAPPSKPFLPQPRGTFPCEFADEWGRKTVVEVPWIHAEDVPDEAWGEDIVL